MRIQVDKQEKKRIVEKEKEKNDGSHGDKNEKKNSSDSENTLPCCSSMARIVATRGNKMEHEHAHVQPSIRKQW